MKRRFSDRARVSALALATALTVMMPRLGFTSDDSAGWTYSEANQKRWGELSDAYKACGEGRRQSPVNLENPVLVGIPDWIGIRYQPMSLDSAMVHTGHSIQTNVPPGSKMVIRGTEYELKQFHFRRPSEHRVENRRYPMEIQFVHADKDGNLAILAVFLERHSSDNAQLERLWRYLPLEKGQSVAGSNVTFNPRALVPDDRSSFRYYGSLTTPPCSEGVLWIVLTDTLRISQRQINRYRLSIAEQTNRIIQPINQRFLLRDQ